MALFRRISLFMLIPTFLQAAPFPSDVSGLMLYRLHKKNIEQAFTAYLEHSKEVKSHDFQLLQQAGIQLLEQGIQDPDPEIQLMCMFGAGVAGTSDLMPILEKGIRSKEMRTQLVALNFLGRLEDDEADSFLLDALSSPHLLTRLEACLQLAQKNHPAILGHLQSLIVKVPPPIRPIFAQIVIHLDGAEGQTFMKQLLTDADVDMRIESILAVASAKRDDFLTQIRALATQGHHAQQEAAAFALGKLKDQESIPYLQTLLTSTRIQTKLVAAVSLYNLGKKEALPLIKEEASQGNLFAINALGKMHEGKVLLQSLLNHAERDVRLNAALSLLRLKDLSGLFILKEILILGRRDLGVARISTPGSSLSAWKIVPSATHNTKLYPGIVQSTRQFRENILTTALELPEDDFFKITKLIFDEKQEDLIPLVIQLLQNMRTEKALKLLHEGAQKAGAPLVRNYCTLALYRLGEEGPFEEQLINWVSQTAQTAIIRFREEDEKTASQLNPESTSSFLVEAFEALASAQNDAGVEALIDAMAYGNPKNRYALAGLLIRTTE